MDHFLDTPLSLLSGFRCNKDYKEENLTDTENILVVAIGGGS